MCTYWYKQFFFSENLLLIFNFPDNVKHKSVFQKLKACMQQRNKKNILRILSEKSNTKQFTLEFKWLIVFL